MAPQVAVTPADAARLKALPMSAWRTLVLLAAARDPTALCARCHQFNFPVDRGPGHALWHTREPMQNTVGEWLRSEAGEAREGCAQCHMRGGDHGLRTVSDASVLARAVEVEVRACREGPSWRVGRRLRVTRAVHFARRERYDGRLAPPAPDAADDVTLRVPATGDSPVLWRLEHWRTAPEIAARQRLPLSSVRLTVTQGSAQPCSRPRRRAMNASKTQSSILE